MPVFKSTAHREWQDWMLLALGILICLSPSLANSSFETVQGVSAVLAGLVIIFVAQLEIVALSRWEEVINLICGAWIAAAPLLLGYNNALRPWHFALGGLVVLISLYELWQDSRA